MTEESLSQLVNPQGTRESFAEALYRGMRSTRTSRTGVTLYWSEGILKASKLDSKTYGIQLQWPHIEIVGTYPKNANLTDIYDDLKEFYK